MQNKVILTLLIVFLLASTALSYTASNSQLNITIYDSYNSYHKESNNLNITMQPSIQGYNSYANLNITFAEIAFFQIGPGGTTTSTSTSTTSTSSTSTSSIATTSILSSGGGGGGSTPDTEIVYVDRPIPIITEIVKEIASQPEIIYKEVLKESPYRLSSVLLAIIMIILLSIRIGSFITKRRRSLKHHRTLRKEIKSKLKHGHAKQHKKARHAKYVKR